MSAAVGTAISAPDTIIDSKESLAAALEILSRARRETGFTAAGSAEARSLVNGAYRRLYELCYVFGTPNPQHPDCRTCKVMSVLGFGPNHEASRFCESGRHPHCSCDRCF